MKRIDECDECGQGLASSRIICIHCTNSCLQCLIQELLLCVIHATVGHAWLLVNSVSRVHNYKLLSVYMYFV